MKRTFISVFFLSVSALTPAGCASAHPSGSHVHNGGAPGHYLGQTPPGMTPELFAPGVVNTEAIELNGVLSPDGREFFFTRIVDDIFTMHRRVREDGRWTDPRPLSVYPDGEKATAVDMAYSPDGRQLYFLGRGSTDLPGENGLNLWVIQREGDGWSEARIVPPPVSTEYSESYPCVVADGSLYFSSRRPGGHGASDIFRAQRLADGSFAEPVNVGPPINTDFSEGDTYVAPDESYLIVTSSRPGGFGQGDLYASFRDENGGWTEPVNLGETINSDRTDFCPMVTPDGRYLFFSRRWGASWDETTRCEIYWVDARVLEQFRPSPRRSNTASPLKSGS
jgi:dipeptidyl aminopeptidase/acylaminoacyl peptidase